MTTFKTADATRFIGLYRQGRSAEKRFELRAANLETILIGKDHDDHVHASYRPGFDQAPALGYDAPGPVPSDGVAVFSYGNENGAGFRAAVWLDVETHALGGPAYPIVEHLGNVSSRPDALGLPESEITSAPFVVRHGDQYFFFSSEVLSLVRPLALRLLMMSRPLLVFMRALKPNFLTRRVLLG